MAVEPHALRTGYLLNGVKRGDPRNAPRCGAKTRKATQCQGPAMENGRCRMHGGKSTGPRTPEGLSKSRRARWLHGKRSAEAIARRKRFAALIARAMGQNRKARETFKSTPEPVAQTCPQI